MQNVVCVCVCVRVRAFSVPSSKIFSYAFFGEKTHFKDLLPIWQYLCKFGNKINLKSFMVILPISSSQFLRAFCHMLKHSMTVVSNRHLCIPLSSAVLSTLRLQLSSGPTSLKISGLEQQAEKVLRKDDK